MRKANIQKFIQEAIESLQKKGDLPFLDIKSFQVKIEIPADKNKGDFATNIAMVLARHEGANESPMELAEIIQKELLKSKAANFSKIEIAQPGFINFFLSQDALLKEFQNILSQKENYGNNNDYKGKKIIIEFTDPNPFKALHIGHLYSNTVGESISKLFKASGADVKKACYQGDIGLHVAKAIYGIQERMLKENISLKDLEQKSLQERIEFIAQCYVAGDKAYKDTEEAKKEIIEINKRIFSKAKEVISLYEKGRQWSLEKFEEVYKRIGSGFDYYFFESEEGPKGAKIVKENLANGVFEESQGAIIFPGERYGLHNRVFINSHNLPTYEAKELGLAKTKYNKFPYNISIIITGNEVDQYFKVLIMALSKISPELAQKTRHISHGMIRVPGGKMSSREGNVILAENLLDEIKNSVLNSFKFEGFKNEEEIEGAAEKISQAAIKYSFLKSAIGGDIIFDKEKSLSIKGGSGPYLQYTAVRCKSILKKSGFKSGKKNIVMPNDVSEEELDVMKVATRFSDVVTEAVEKMSPSLICSFALSLAQKYNTFYDKHNMLKIEDKELLQFRLAITFAAFQVLENSLYLLGIEVPEKM